MKKKLILHIGTTKTGSTSLQNYLFTNRARLLEKSILFPKTGFRVLEGSNVPTSGHSDLFYKEGILKDLVQEIEENPCNTVLISTEIISLIISGHASKYISKLESLLSQFSEIQVVVYLRRQDLWTESQYIDSVTNVWKPFSSNIHTFLKEQQSLDLDYHSFLKKIKKTLNYKKICIRTYDKKYMPEGIIPDFMEVLSIDDYSGWAQPLKPQHNISYGDDTVQLSLLLNHLPFPESWYTRFMEGWIPDRSSKSSKAVYFSEAERNLLIEKFAQSNRYVAKTYLNRNDGALFSETEAKELKGASIKHKYSYQTIKRVVGSIATIMEATKIEISNSNDKVKEIQDRLSNANQKYRESTTNITQLNKKLVSLVEDRKNEKTLTEDLKLQSKNLTEQIDQLSQQLQTEIGLHKALEIHYSDLSQASALLNQQLQDEITSNKVLGLLNSELTQKSELVNQQLIDEKTSHKALELLNSELDQKFELVNQQLIDEKISHQALEILNSELELSLLQGKKDYSLLQNQLQHVQTKRTGHYNKLESERKNNKALTIKLKALEQENSTIKRTIGSLKNSIAYQAGTHIRNAQSIKGLLKLPLALFRVYKSYKIRQQRSSLITQNTSFNINSDKQEHGSNFKHKEKKVNSTSLKIKAGLHGWPLISVDKTKPVVLGVMDEFTTGCFNKDVHLIQPRPDNWESLSIKYKPSLFFIESAWKGNYGSWQYRVASYANKPGNEIQQISEYAKTNKTPIVFWNKEDPVHHEKFMDSAKLANVIFTTDANMIGSYQEKTGNKEVYSLPFAAQPLIHRPSSINHRIKKSCFAGSWYGGRHAERSATINWLLKAAAQIGLEIYDRNYGTGIFPFPEEYNQCIKGSLSYEKLCKKYSKYRVFLNVNSVTNSPTMFSRRVFELLACGTPVVSTYALGIEELLGSDTVWIVKNETEAKQAIQTLLSDDKEWRRRSLAGIRKVFASHTYLHRLQYIYEKTGTKFNWKVEPKLLLAAKARTDDDLDALVNFSQNQSWEGFTLFVECDLRKFNKPNTPPTIKLVPKKYFNSDKPEKEFDTYELAGWISPLSEYGPNYLQDLINATRYEPDAEIWGKAATQKEFTYNAKVYSFATIQRICDFSATGHAKLNKKSIRGEKIYCLDKEEYSPVKNKSTPK